MKTVEYGAPERETYPETLYVREKQVDHYPLLEVRAMVGEENLEEQVPDSGKEYVVATYRLVKLERYKKTVTKTSVVEKVGE